VTTMAHVGTFADVRHHPVTTAVLVFLFWLGASVLVATSHRRLDALSGPGSAIAAMSAIVAAAYAYTRSCARCAGLDHALGVGLAWLVLAIVTEIAVSSRLGHGWYALIGTPDRPLLRNIFLFVWIFAPALFAHRKTDA
jgi:hypothetical protein